MQSCWDEMCNLGENYVLGGIGTNSWKDKVEKKDKVGRITSGFVRLIWKQLIKLME